MISFGEMEMSIDKDLKYWLTTKNKPTVLDELPPKPPSIIKPPHEDPLPISCNKTEKYKGSLFWIDEQISNK